MDNNPSKKSTIIWTIVIVVALLALLMSLLVVFGLVSFGHPKAPPPVIISQATPTPLVSIPIANQQSAKCRSDLAVQAEKSAGAIASSTILVSFTASTSLAEAEATLASAGASTTSAVTSGAFSRSHLVQAAVIPGDAIAVICTLRATSTVHYAGFDQLFFLHP